MSILPAAMRGERRLAGNIFSLYILQGLNYIVPMAVLPYLVRVLGMNMYGLYAFAQSFALYFTLFTDYGFNFSATRSVAMKNDDREAVSRVFSSVLVIKLTFMLVGALVLVTVVDLVPRFHQNSAFFFVAYAAVIGNVLFPLWYFQGIEQMGYISGIVGISRLLGAAALFGFVHHPTDALLALAIQSAVPVVGGVAGLWVAFHKLKVRPSRPSAADVKATLVDGWHLFISTAAISLYTNTNVFLVGLLAGNVQAGYFSVAEKMVRALQGLFGPVTQAVFPHIANLAAKSRDAAVRFAVQMLLWMGAASLAVSIGVLLLARPAVLLLFGHSAAGSLPVVRWIAFLPFVVTISNVLGIQVMVPFGLDRQFSRILFFAGLLNLALAIPLIRLYTAPGAGASVLVTEFIVAALMFLILRRHNVHLFHSMRVSA